MRRAGLSMPPAEVADVSGRERRNYIAVPRPVGEIKRGCWTRCRRQGLRSFLGRGGIIRLLYGNLLLDGFPREVHTEHHNELRLEMAAEEEMVSDAAGRCECALLMLEANL